MSLFRRVLLLLLCTVVLAACNRGLVRRVSEPAVSLQQVSVGADGRWKVELRVQNYSSIPMRFEAIDLNVTVNGQDAGPLRANPGYSIGPESADVVNVDFSPSANARMAVANALAGGQLLPYTLKGSVQTTPEDEKPRSFDLDMHSSLSAAPGLPGVLR